MNVQGGVGDANAALISFLDLYAQVIYVMPSTSGRAATYPRRADKLKFFLELKQLRDRLRMQP